MEYKLRKMPNGLSVLSLPMPQLTSATVMLWTKVGSRSEDTKISGISHFLEHMVFKGSKKRPSAKAIAEAVDSFGGEFNAGTSKEYTNFYIRARNSNLDTACDILSDMVLSPILPSVEMEREKGVIVEEIGMYEDTPMYHIGDVFENLIFEGSNLGRDIIGTRDTVRGMKIEDFIRYRKKHYITDNMLLTIAGGVSEKEIENLAQKYFSDIPQGKGNVVKKISMNQKKPKLLLSSQKKEQAHFILGFRGYPRGHNKRFAEAVLSAILGGGMSSRLFTEVRERRGLAYSVRSGVEHYQDAGYLEAYAGVDPKRVDDAIKVTLDQHYGIASGEYPIDAVELKKGKEFLKGNIALSLENTKSTCAFFGERALFLGDIESVDEIFKKINAVTTEDLVEVAKEAFVPKNLNLAIIGPYNRENRFEKLINV